MVDERIRTEKYRVGGHEVVRFVQRTDYIANTIAEQNAVDDKLRRLNERIKEPNYTRPYDPDYVGNRR